MMNMELTAKNLVSHGYKAVIFETSKQAVEFLNDNIKGETVGFGGSKTLESLNLFEELKSNNTVYWHWKEKYPREECCKFSCYLTSANAVSQTGELVNIDGTGNRISATLFGAEKLFFIVGENKIAEDLQSACERAKNVAAPPNAKRLNLDTPCAKTGKCHDCNSPQRICNAMTVYMRPLKSFKETWVILIREQLGF